ncbi:hypothetical protein EDI_136490 [Entamoeba dispar SAW760]|uniref:Uncharacterized protein n=1 Tax=Entamoeba dispar (strain ATCC PRA-260 / SAW760) TaxID=370354 RepID=B0ELC8_ENTDS|nr:uncharacterized protein EDI_136490 [Entamoeba dispar SAW760]EDR24667.1 hypothetical protein EDI_136490 [Entamoeba dispar SAW760]|eukprot:EDR24667.1 hypothetical protein EDI_136490 [Entamoeba dispar SAW760]
MLPQPIKTTPSALKNQTSNSLMNQMKYKSEESQTKLISFLMYVLYSLGYSFVVRKPTKVNCQRMSIIPICEIRDIFGNVVFNEDLLKEDEIMKLVCQVKKESLHQRIKAKYSRVVCANFMTQTIDQFPNTSFIFGTSKKTCEIETQCGNIHLPAFPKIQAATINNFLYDKNAMENIGSHFYKFLIDQSKNLKKLEQFIVSPLINAV